VTVFETETMAELCVKQGLVSEALTIYRRLVADAPDASTGARRAARLGELERIAKGAVAARAERPAAAALPGAPALTVERSGDTLVFSWSLPVETQSPALQLLLVRRGAEGIETETRTVRLDAVRGTTRVEVPALHSVRAAAGWLDGARFVPLVRLAALSP